MMRKMILAACFLAIGTSVTATAQDSARRAEQGGSGTIIAITRPESATTPVQVRGMRGEGSAYGGILPGLVLGASGQPVSGAHIVLSNASNTRTITVTSGTDGRFTADGLAAGEYTANIIGGAALNAVEGNPAGGLLLRVASGATGREAQNPRSIRFGFRFQF